MVERSENKNIFMDFSLIWGNKRFFWVKSIKKNYETYLFSFHKKFKNYTLLKKGDFSH